MNPFLLARDQTTEIQFVTIGYRVRTDYANALKVLKTIQKGYTLEAVLDDILTHYFENTVEGREAVEKAKILYS